MKDQLKPDYYFRPEFEDFVLVLVAAMIILVLFAKWMGWL